MTTNHNKAISGSSPKRAVVLLSGGLDSATSLAIAKSQGYLCHCLTVLYGQRHSIEVEAASGVALQQGVAEHRFVSVDLRVFGGSALTADLEVPKDSLSITGIPVTYVPARNTVFLALALGFAEVVDAAAIFVGVNAVDYSGYPDCRPEFIAAFQNLASLATKSGVEGVPFRIEAPLINLTKAEIIQIGLSLGVDYSLTHSCYDPEGGNACGRCDSCLIRLKAFSDLGLSDPAIRERG